MAFFLYLPSGISVGRNSIARNRPAGNKPAGNRPAGNRPAGNKPSGNRPAGDKTSAARVFHIFSRVLRVWLVKSTFVSSLP